IPARILGGTVGRDRVLHAVVIEDEIDARLAVRTDDEALPVAEALPDRLRDRLGDHDRVRELDDLPSFADRVGEDRDDADEADRKDRGRDEDLEEGEATSAASSGRVSEAPPQGARLAAGR